MYEKRRKKVKEEKKNLKIFRKYFNKRKLVFDFKLRNKFLYDG